MDDAVIERQLREAQDEIAAAREAKLRRQAAVMAAKDAGWSKYRIARVLGVGGPTVDSIIAAAERTGDEPGSTPKTQSRRPAGAPVAAELARERSRDQRDDDAAGSRAAIRNLPSMR